MLRRLAMGSFLHAMMMMIQEVALCSPSARALFCFYSSGTKSAVCSRAVFHAVLPPSSSTSMLCVGYEFPSSPPSVSSSFMLYENYQMCIEMVSQMQMSIANSKIACHNEYPYGAAMHKKPTVFETWTVCTACWCIYLFISLASSLPELLLASMRLQEQAFCD